MPILMKEDGIRMPESLNIVHHIDHKYRAPLLIGKINPAISDWLRHINGYLNKLLLRIAQAPFAEFALPEARRYFGGKKEACFGSVEELKLHAGDHSKKC